jgi:hypothetical protein
MALPAITINRGTSGLGRPLTGEDHISGFLAYISDANLPAGFTTSDRAKIVYSVADAEALGITDLHDNEVKATGTVTITGVGANGDTIEILVSEYGNPTGSESVSLGVTTKTSAETTVTLLAALIVTTINAGTETHGYTATNLAGVITITAREGLGIFLNSGTPISTTIVGTITRTLGQFSGGVASDIDQVHYHISEYFRRQPKGVLYVYLADIPGTFNFAEVPLLYAFAGGVIRQLGVYITDDTLDAAMVTALDAVMMSQAELFRPSSAVLTADFNGTALSALPTLATNSDYRVSVAIGQDGSGKGFELYKALGKTVGSVGAILGAVSFAKVSDSIAWVDKFEMSDGIENDLPAFGNGVLFRDQTAALLSQLNSYKYVFLRKFEGKTNTFVSDSPTAIASTNDLGQIENVRTVDKAARGIYANCLGLLNSPLLLNEDGTLTEDTISEFTRRTEITLDDMSRNREVSAFQVSINPAQDVLTTSKIVVTISIVPVGVARQIDFNINFTTSL